MRENGEPIYSQNEKEQIANDVYEEQQDDLRARLIDLREDVVREVRALLDTENLLGRLSGKLDTFSNNRNSANGIKNGEQMGRRNEGIHGKKFKLRESELTSLMRINHIATIYNVFVATLISLFLSTVMHDYIASGSVNLGFHLISWNFSQMHITIAIWLEMMGFVMGLYYGYVTWAKIQASLSCKSIFVMELLNIGGLVLLILYFFFHMVLPGVQVRRSSLPPAAALIVVCEQVRLLMKVYAFVRTNVPRTLQHSATSPGTYFVPSFSKYFYFLFAPTLIYRDEYPRTKSIRWGYAAARFAEVLSIIVYLGFMIERYMLPMVRDFGKPGKPFIHLVPLIIDMSTPAVIGIVCIFYSVLHAWLNGMAEILRFGDRMFYQDWWNTTVYSEYYKTWNIVVYDWLYTFIYKDAGSLLFTNRYVRAIFVIAVSAIFHEYIVAMGAGFCMPVFIVIYGFGGPMVMQLSSSNRMIGNVWIWFTLCLGSGMMLTLYLAEYFARVNCPRTIESDLLDFMVPRMFFCSY